jgi:hypothetical protein
MAIRQHQTGADHHAGAEHHILAASRRQDEHRLRLELLHQCVVAERTRPIGRREACRRGLGCIVDFRRRRLELSAELDLLEQRLQLGLALGIADIALEQRLGIGDSGGEAVIALLERGDLALQNAGRLHQRVRYDGLLRFGGHGRQAIEQPPRRQTAQAEDDHGQQESP